MFMPAKPASPTQDERWKIVDATIRRVGQHSRGVIETLHTVQESFGYLDEAALRYVAVSLRTPLSRVYGVATFYHLFALKPPGQHACLVCTGTACHIKRSAVLVTAAKQALEIELGKTTLDGKVSLRGERCIGPCGLAPVVVYDGQVAAEETPGALIQHLEEWMDHDT
jgi:bidirectional [NiFe] hydrogenase diaphorase subunit